MIAVDTSVIVAAFATWHESHGQAAAVVSDGPDLPLPCALETYAVLTRLPPPHRADPAIVVAFIESAFPKAALALPGETAAHLIGELATLGVTGGASYDAVIAVIARHHGRQLVTLDVRARQTYDRVGVSVRLLA